MATTRQAQPTLYDRDSYSWALEQARALAERRIEDLDWENLAEEVGDLARSERRAFRSQCATLVEDLLELAFAAQPIVEHNQRLWKLTLKEARRKIRRLLAESPGLNSSVQELFEEAWLVGRDEALKFLDLGDDAIAEAPLSSFEQAMDDDFIPAGMI